MIIFGGKNECLEIGFASKLETLLSYFKKWDTEEISQAEPPLEGDLIFI